jgi:hypothetical protein
VAAGLFEKFVNCDKITRRHMLDSNTPLNEVVSRFQHFGHVNVVINLSCLTNSILSQEDVWGCGCINPRILDLGTRLRRWSASRCILV